jgi:hypothetical protein
LVSSRLTVSLPVLLEEEEVEEEEDESEESSDGGAPPGPPGGGGMELASWSIVIPEEVLDELDVVLEVSDVLLEELLEEVRAL